MNLELKKKRRGDRFLLLKRRSIGDLLPRNLNSKSSKEPERPIEAVSKKDYFTEVHPG